MDSLLPCFVFHLAVPADENLEATLCKALSTLLLVKIVHVHTDTANAEGPTARVVWSRQSQKPNKLGASPEPERTLQARPIYAPPLPTLPYCPQTNKSKLIPLSKGLSLTFSEGFTSETNQRLRKPQTSLAVNCLPTSRSSRDVSPATLESRQTDDMTIFSPTGVQCWIRPAGLIGSFYGRWPKAS